MFTFVRSTNAFVSRLFRKIAIACFVIGIFGVVITIFIRSFTRTETANTNRIIQSYTDETYKVLNDPKNNKTPSQKGAMAGYRFIVCPVAGIGCSNNPADAEKDFNKSAFGLLSRGMTIPFTHPPASGITETYYTLAGAGIVPSSYAAEGIGFSAIRPFREIWRIFRNLSYAVLVLVIVAMGFLVMFRAKIGAQTAIGVEAALPRIVISLIMITFSYAIAGFLIDIMYVLTGLIVSILGQGINLTPHEIAQRQNEYLTGGIGTILGKILPSWGEMWDVSYAIVQIFPPIIQFVLKTIAWLALQLVSGYVIAIARDLQISTALNGICAFTFCWGNIPGMLISIALWGFLSLFSGWILSALITGIITLTAFALFMRILMLILTTYLRILFFIFFAPIFMLYDTIPGRGTLVYWFQNMIGELLTFPVIVGLVLTTDLIMLAAKEAIVDPNSPGFWHPPLLYNVDQNAFIVIIGVGLTLLIPDMVQMVKDAVGAKGPPLNLGLGTFFSGVGMVGMGAGGLVGTAMSWSERLYGKDAGKEGKGAFGILNRVLRPGLQPIQQSGTAGHQAHVDPNAGAPPPPTGQGGAPHNPAPAAPTTVAGQPVNVRPSGIVTPSSSRNNPPSGSGNNP